jgi:hypothetical protein
MAVPAAGECYNRAVAGARAITCAVGVICAMLMGCGRDDRSPPKRIPGLAAQQGAVLGNVCLSPSDPHDAKGRRITKRARRQLAVLLEALREQPETRVATIYYTDSSLFDSGGKKSEVLSVRELGEREIQSGDEILGPLGATGSWARCVRRVQAQIRSASG